MVGVIKEDIVDKWVEYIIKKNKRLEVGARADGKTNMKISVVLTDGRGQRRKMTSKHFFSDIPKEVMLEMLTDFLTEVEFRVAEKRKEAYLKEVV